MYLLWILLTLAKEERKRSEEKSKATISDRLKF